MEQIKQNIAVETEQAGQLVDLAILMTYSCVYGIHFIVSSQEPRADVFKQSIKSNAGARVCYRVRTSLSSLMLLDAEGAERLRGKGECLIAESGKEGLEKCQAVYISGEQLKSVLQAIKNSWG